MHAGLQDFDKLPATADDIGAYVEEQLVNNHKNMLLMYPRSDAAQEPTFVRYACGVELRFDEDGKTYVGGQQGQIVATGRRLLGMVTEGTVGAVTLDAATRRRVLGFSIPREEFGPPQLQTNWRGKPVAVTVRSVTDERPFVLRVFSVVASIKNDGQTVPSNLDSFITRLSAEGAADLERRSVE